MGWNIRTDAEFDRVAKGLEEIANDNAKNLNWSRTIENNEWDDGLYIYNIKSYDELNERLKDFPPTKRNYHRTRWFSYTCKACDIYVMRKAAEAVGANVTFDGYSMIFGNKRFDVNFTVIPKDYRSNESIVDNIINDPSLLMKTYYAEQSKGSRYKMQNRVFVIHHSFISKDRVPLLRTAWNVKSIVYKKFFGNINDIEFYRISEDTECGAIFICEKNERRAKCKIYGLDNKNKNDNESNCNGRHTRSQELEGADRHEGSECVCRGLF